MEIPRLKIKTASWKPDGRLAKNENTYSINFHKSPYIGFYSLVLPSARSARNKTPDGKPFFIYVNLSCKSLHKRSLTFTLFAKNLT